MSAMKPQAGHFERQAKADEARHGAGAIKAALCESAQAEHEIDGQAAQFGQARESFTAYVQSLKRVPQRMVRLPHCAAQHKKFTKPKYLCEEALGLGKNHPEFGLFGDFLQHLNPIVKLT
ncbi:hypothetical protein [Mesorhizobium sophorae]|uniref:hypothetical protein n=1 Tax=Mesorhizobium sophorae TaxID=1300294 RepID=UPI000BA49486|nr:hypothetical protein [Mesorhizobium sophorae]